MSKATDREEPNEVREAFQRLKRFFWLRAPEMSAMLREALAEWRADNVPRLGASLAFYTLLSLAPLLVVVIAIAAMFYGKEAAQGQLFWQIRGLVGRDEARAIQGFIYNAYNPGAGLVATLLGVVTLTFGASSVVVELRDSLNTIWHVHPYSGASGISSIIFLLKERFYAIAMVLSVGFLLLVSLILNACIAALGAIFGSALPIPELALHVATFVVSFAVTTGLFAAIYKLLPDVHLKWSDVLVGASATSLLFAIGKLLIGIYLGKAGYRSSYGAAGSLVVVVVWVYYSAQLFFLGAEFTKVYTKYCGSHLSNALKLNTPKLGSVLGDSSGAQPPVISKLHSGTD